MDLATIIGIIGGIIAIFGGIAMRRGGVLMFWSISSILITFGGTFAALLVNYPLKTVINAFRTVKKVFTIREEDTGTLIYRFVDFARRIRTTEGLRALDKELPGIKDDFLRRGIELVSSGADQNLIKSELETEIIFTQERHRVGQEVFVTLGTYSPAFGMIGTIIGLILMLGHLEDQAQIAGGMALALLTTFYGATAAYLIFLPTAGKLKRRSEDEILVKQVMIQGILSLQAGELPSIMEAKLRAYLPRKEKKLVPVAPVVGPAAAPRK